MTSTTIETGRLMTYADARDLREATEEETLASIEAARRDGGAGVIKVDGVSCYVEGGRVVESDETKWDAEGYWNAVIGRGAAQCVSEFDLVADEKSLSTWLHEAEHEAWRAGGSKGPQPAEWDAFHGPAVERLLEAARDAQGDALTAVSYIVEIRNAFGGGEWGGSPLGATWRPAICGTLNQTDESDEAASTFTRRDRAVLALDTVARQLPAGYEMEPEMDGCDGYELRVRGVVA